MLTVRMSVHQAGGPRFLGPLAVLLSLLLLPAAALAGETIELHVRHASIVSDRVGQIAMQLELTPQSRDDFAAFTGRHVGDTIDLSVDGKVLMSPRLMEPIAGGLIMVSGSLAQGELERMTTRISQERAKVEAAGRDP
jgi:preprotein translocase subunit SecD